MEILITKPMYLSIQEICDHTTWDCGNTKCLPVYGSANNSTK